MNALARALSITAPAVLLLALSARAAADIGGASFSPPPASLCADVEIDPTAYVLKGYSVHVGLGWKRLRVDLGAYAMDVPPFFHGNDGFDLAFDGFGLTLQVFPFAEQGGPFVGLGAGVTREIVSLRDTDSSSRHIGVGAGIDVGWRINLPAGFYVKPWVGFNFKFNPRDVKLGGQTYEDHFFGVFPAIHLGYRFR
jgi:hypothetical protein